jgi:hypothetical protein
VEWLNGKEARVEEAATAWGGASKSLDGLDGLILSVVSVASVARSRQPNSTGIFRSLDWQDRCDDRTPN